MRGEKCVVGLKRLQKLDQILFRQFGLEGREYEHVFLVNYYYCSNLHYFLNRYLLFSNSHQSLSKMAKSAVQLCNREMRTPLDTADNTNT